MWPDVIRNETEYTSHTHSILDSIFGTAWQLFSSRNEYLVMLRWLSHTLRSIGCRNRNSCKYLLVANDQCHQTFVLLCRFLTFIYAFLEYICQFFYGAIFADSINNITSNINFFFFLNKKPMVHSSTRLEWAKKTMLRCFICEFDMIIKRHEIHSKRVVVIFAIFFILVCPSFFIWYMLYEIVLETEHF